MNKTLLMALVGLFLSTQLAAAQEPAKTQHHAKSGAIPTAPLTHQEPNTSSTSLERWGVGFASISGIGGGNAALSAWLDLEDNWSLQPVVALSSTSPFAFGIGGFVRKTIQGGKAAGFHIGGGLHLGSTAVVTALGATSSKFYFDIAPIAGFHFLFPGTTNIGLSVDGGLNISVTDGNFNMSAAPQSGALLGLAVHYFF